MKPVESLLSYIRVHDDREIIKGFRLFEKYRDEIIFYPIDEKLFSIDVPSESRPECYEVELKILASRVDDDCECRAFENFGQCKHCLAAAMYLLNDKFNQYFAIEDFLFAAPGSPAPVVHLDNAKLGIKVTGKIPAKPATAEESNSIWKIFLLRDDLKSQLSRLSGEYWIRDTHLRKLTQTSFTESPLHWIFQYGANKPFFLAEIKYDKKARFEYRCTCMPKGRHVMCVHVHSIFEKLSVEDEQYFTKLRDWREEKIKLLQPYGLMPEDAEAAAFKFSITHYGELQVTPPPSFILPTDHERLTDIYRSLKPHVPDLSLQLRRPSSPGTALIDFETGFVFNNDSRRLQIGFELEPAKIFQKGSAVQLKKLSINTPANLPLLNELTDEAFAQLVKLRDDGLQEFLYSQGYSYLKNYSSPWQHLGSDTQHALKKHYIESLMELWPHIAGEYPCFLLEDGKFSRSNCKPTTFAKEEAEISFVVSANEKLITVQLKLSAGGEEISNFEILHGFLFRVGDSLHILKDKNDLGVLETFRERQICLPATAKINVIRHIIAPLLDRYPVQLPESFSVNTLSVNPAAQVMLSELNGQQLLIRPQFVYEDNIVDYSSYPEDIVTNNTNGSMTVIKRDAGFEKNIFEQLRLLHHNFAGQRQNDLFYVHFNDVMKGNWFLNTVRHLQQNDIAVKGMQDLKKFRYSTATPKWEMKAGSGIDWFDLKITVSFGDEEVPLKDIRKAVLSKQNIVVLGDGSFGVLPEEWLKQYGLLLKMGEEKKEGGLRVSKMHFTIIDELQKEINDEKIAKEISAKKQKLSQVGSIKTTKVSKKIKAELRPYQVSGLQWMQVLEGLEWGGCLADDMGLGKTLQTICFLQHLKEKYKKGTHLVVCPTSLIYNWETELQKFAPSLRYHIHYGNARCFSDEHFELYDLVITTYGLVRNDMEELLRFEWHYVILDESQAIKNPDSQTTKAVQSLHARNRLILSGTPVQNNTFDLFAQFNFLNPGLLGTKDFFKSEFANPIDKYNDAEKSSSLRKLVYPFLLRRTKEQVAKDLPDKTETVLWCSMGKEQRAVYEDYKQYYRQTLMQKIEEEGMAKSGIYLLEGLLRLRQICCSPQLLSDKEVSTEQSIKMEELLREIQENTGAHKLLIFSQFTSMLKLIEKELQQKKMAYCYLDGSTPALKRKEQVKIFQTDESVKLFLVSLKAGGVGLNLTAADYVYVVDPWWNPAVEQQAIDRTHRIGQTKKIFAYKMICKDSVEEKIIQLQQRKKQLANELVTEDAGFIKKLTKEDVQFLFS